MDKLEIKKIKEDIEAKAKNNKDGEAMLRFNIYSSVNGMLKQKSI